VTTPLALPRFDVENVPFPVIRRREGEGVDSCYWSAGISPTSTGLFNHGRICWLLNVAAIHPFLFGSLFISGVPQLVCAPAWRQRPSQFCLFCRVSVDRLRTAGVLPQNRANQTTPRFISGVLPSSFCAFGTAPASTKAHRQDTWPEASRVWLSHRPNAGLCISAHRRAPPVRHVKGEIESSPSWPREQPHKRGISDLISGVYWKSVIVLDAGSYDARPKPVASVPQLPIRGQRVSTGALLYSAVERDSGSERQRGAAVDADARTPRRSSQIDCQKSVGR
jgi:hypothetical protein